MKVSFNETINPQDEKALVPAQPTALSTTFYQDADAEGEINQSDVRIPRLNVVAKVGELSNVFTPGDLVLNKETKLVAKEQPIIVTPVKIRKTYQEDTEFGEDMGRTAKTLAEVQAFGGQIDDREGEKFWIPVADIIFLVKKPANASPDADALFYEEIGGEQYLLAAYTARKSAYTAVAKPIFRAKLQSGTVKGLNYELSVKLRTYEGNTWFAPNLRPAGKPSEALATYLSSVTI